jgi:glycosyltransferase involved in cell wall biosynthesis
MKIALTIPSFAVHGGIRIIIEWANRLSEKHDVVLYCRRGRIKRSWNVKVKVTKDYRKVKDRDLLIICSPHDVDLQEKFGGKVVFFLQMLEHLFRPKDKQWEQKCLDLYGSESPLISISQWNIQYIKSIFPNRDNIFYIGNGVNFDDFPIDENCQKEKTVLVEGWNALNASKDVNRIAPRVAKKLKSDGYKIIAYAQDYPVDFCDVPDKFYRLPTLSRLNGIYSEASIMLKASKYDARSCSPVEAMTKGTPTARAITLGDDDLINEYNCLKVAYDEKLLYKAAKRILTDDFLLNGLSKNCIEHVKTECSWDKWMPKIDGIIERVMNE